jgi:hypothetical protein
MTTTITTVTTKLNLKTQTIESDQIEKEKIISL